MKEALKAKIYEKVRDVSIGLNRLKLCSKDF